MTAKKRASTDAEADVTATRSLIRTMTRMPVADLRVYHRNPRQGNVTAIANSLRINHQYRPIVVNVGTHTGRPSEVLAGNHTLIAARDLNWDDIEVVLIDVDDDQAARIVAADNRTADLADYDDRLLAELLGSLSDLDGTGYDPGDLDDLLAKLGDVDLGEFREYGDDTADDVRMLTCPSCGHQWAP